MLIASLFLAILVLGLKTGFLMGASWLTMKRIGTTAALFGVCVVVLSLAFNNQYLFISQLIDKYTFDCACFAGILFIYLGLQQPKRMECVPSSERFKFWLSFFPCPLCVGALTVSVIFVAGYLHWNLLLVALAAGVVFTLITLLTAWFLRRFLTNFCFDIINFFHQSLLFFGSFTLISALLIPNIVAVMSNEYQPLTIDSPYQVGLMVVAFLVLCLLGILKHRYERSKKLFEKG